ncbi:MAG: KamA family radical SAM protein [Bacteroidales bacterium]|nr:KamA family radical SAM protein [Bacteroidales bacterium]
MNGNQAQEFASTDGEVPLGLAAFATNSAVIENHQKQQRNLRSDFTVISPSSKGFILRNFPGITSEQWNSWKWQIQNSYTTFSKLSHVIDFTGFEEIEALKNTERLPLRITPYYASLMADYNPENPIRKAVVPTIRELFITPGEASDPLHEENCSPVPNLVHRYPDRVLFLSTGFCAAYCRYCTRSHMVAKDKMHYGIAAWQPALEYIRRNSQIRDVIISGGDPLTLPETHLDYLLSSLRSIPHIEIIRIGTKVPVVLPQRITQSLVRMLKRYHPLFMSIHFMHPAELTPEVHEACSRLADAGIPLGSQTVLLKGINDSVQIMGKLMKGLLINRVRPYYIYQCDPIPGSSHFRTSVNTGLEIIKGLRGHTSGYAIPHYVIDAPGGGGKIPLLPEYFLGKEDENIVLQNYEGKRFYYPDEVL